MFGRNETTDIHNRTGVTGYIGGDAFYALQKDHSELHFSLLVRSVDKGRLVQQKYPSVRIVVGGLDDYDLLVEEAAQADIVLRK